MTTHRLPMPARILSYAREACGFERADISARVDGARRAEARRVMQQLLATGELIAADSGPLAPRYFASQALADAWVAAGRPNRRKQAPKPRREPGTVVRSKHLVLDPAAPVVCKVKPKPMVLLPDRHAVVLPAGYVSALDSAECRPWARVAAQHIEARHG